MGELIVLAHHRADRSRPSARRRGVAFFFDLACPFSYLASERVERLLGDVDWVPTASLHEFDGECSTQAERLAADLRLPLVWPERFPASSPRAIRAAAYAAQAGRSAQFALAAGRLAFAGGFDIDDPEILADAAAAAGLSPAACLAAAADPAWEAQPAATAAGLARRGVRELPAFGVGASLHCGWRAIGETAALRHAVALAKAARDAG
ncbi:MAG TPA: DsbA family protein [Solirubrobacteraceae bacterium]|nr:DsbA family protein [Solirubrobacteraceae bacterium]